eukprot:CAMPEP_0185420536 /NCGR_PEP_ID=MMETSP1365-20130426/10369_1 /TAXON_ID=38817 /ORGANISM="Gephyrocapsa oceanica, Strain RCC1303" /LENGTH=77 /DNA_ID=CAMNT_0028024181 /DNA_START=48 /DNA_END=278 /DNA_ORIENTATION=-
MTRHRRVVYGPRHQLLKSLCGVHCCASTKYMFTTDLSSHRDRVPKLPGSSYQTTRRQAGTNYQAQATKLPGTRQSAK